MAKKDKKGRRPQANNPSIKASECTQTASQPHSTASSTADKGQAQKHKRSSKARKKHAKRPVKQVPPDSSKKMDEDSFGYTGVDPYGMRESLVRLLYYNRFHPQVTNRTPGNVYEVWELWTEAEAVLQSRDAYFRREAEAPEPLTRGPFVWRGSITERAEPKHNVPASDEATGNTNVVGLETLLQNVHMGAQVIEHVFRDGRKTAMKFARTSRAVWQMTTSNVKIWDCTVGTLVQDGHARIFVAMASKHTVGEVLQVRMNHPYGIADPDHPDLWKQTAINLEGSIFEIAAVVKRRCQSTAVPFWMDKNPPAMSDAEERTQLSFEDIKAMRALKPMIGMWQVNQFIGTPPWSQLFSPPLHMAAKNLRKMMTHISTQRAAIRVLHFHKTPLLDRRMLSIILRACTNVVMLGVYDCPLIHFGDVICIIDLIYELNIARRLENRPEIEAFDFFPHYNEGMPYSHKNAGKYGLTWNSEKLDIVQRGFFCLLLKAFMKAKRMGLKMLFSEGKAFFDYLYRTPNPPFSVVGFLDGINRYLDVEEDSTDRDNEELQAIYDMLKPVRLGLDRYLKYDWTRFYLKTMGKHLFFCSSCGYEMFQEFFTAAGREMRPHTRICAGCTFQALLDGETDHLKDKKRNALSSLCQGWNRRAFNIDAPILEKGRGLIRLKSIICVRPPPPGAYVDAHGVVRMRRYLEPLVRDNKIHDDSLRNLPTLSDLANETVSTALWAEMIKQSNMVDMYCRVVRQLRIDYSGGDGTGIRPFASTRADGGLPDHVEERQRPRDERQSPPSHDMAFSLRFGRAISRQGW